MSWCAVLVLSTVAHAQPSSTASAEAEALFVQGRKLMDEGHFAEACAAFDASQRVGPAVSTLFNQANCREKNHQFATAYGLYREAERRTRARADADMEKLNDVALQRSQNLEPKLSKLTITVKGKPIKGLVISRGDIELDPGAWNQPLPVDGGTHAISARAPGYKEWSQTIEVKAENDMQIIEVPELVALPKPPPTSVDAAPQTSEGSSRVVPIVIGSVGLALAGAGLVTDLVARGEYDDSRKEPDDDKQQSLLEGARTKRYIAQGLAVAGVATVGVAVWLYVRGRRDDRAVDVAPIADGTQAGIQLFGRF